MDPRPAALPCPFSRKVNADGTKNVADFHNNYGYQFKHYHRGRTTSSGTLKKYGKCHSLFGTPVFINKK